MTITMIRRLVTQALVVVVALAAILTSGAPAQSLGDVARREEARRKATANGKTYTNDDLRGAPAAATTPGAAAGRERGSRCRARHRRCRRQAVAGAAAQHENRCQASRRCRRQGRAPRADAARPRAPAPDPKGDAGRRGAASPVDSGRARSRAGVRRCAPEPDQWPHGRISPRGTTRHSGPRSRADRQKALTELDRVKKEIQQHTKALADLQEEARKAGVPPGWLR